MSDSLFETAVRFKGYGSYLKGKSRSCVAGIKKVGLNIGRIVVYCTEGML